MKVIELDHEALMALMIQAHRRWIETRKAIDGDRFAAAAYAVAKSGRERASNQRETRE